MFLTLLSEPESGTKFYAACQASDISGLCFCRGSPWPGYLEQQQRPPTVATTPLVTPANCSSSAKPYHSSLLHISLFHRALHQASQKYASYFFILLRCTETSHRAECVRLLVFSWIKLLFAVLFCTCCALSYRHPQISVTELENIK